MKMVSVYTELDCLFDYRRAIAESLLTPGLKWESTLEKFYKDRRWDHFEFPETGVTQAKFEAAYQARDFSLYTNIIKTGLMPRMFTMVLDVDQMIGKPINVGGINYTVNLYPYYEQFDADLFNELETALKSSVVYEAAFNFVNVPPERLTTVYFRPFTHVFKYNLLMEESKAFMMSITNNPIPDVKFFIPDLFVKSPENGIFVEPEETIRKLQIVLAPSLTLIAVGHHVYDYQA